MRGCRPLSPAECRAVYNAYGGRYRLRNQALHLLCVTSGLRVSEALSLRVGDVVRQRQVVRCVRVARANTKRKVAGRVIELAAPARAAIQRQVDWLLQHGYLAREQYLFRSQAGDRPIEPAEAWRIFTNAARRAGLDYDRGGLGTHCWRKTFAEQANKYFLDKYRQGAALNPLLETSRALGHKNIESTESYIGSWSSEPQRAAVRHMEVVHAYGN